jgi:hypothetical protein
LAKGTYTLNSGRTTEAGYLYAAFADTPGGTENQIVSAYGAPVVVTIDKPQYVWLAVRTPIGYTVSGTFRPQIEAGTTATAYEPYNTAQTLTAQTPNGLPGIPVFSDGNYTDENGQMWVCDEIDFARGKYVQRIGVVDYSNSNAPSVSIGGTKDPTKYRWILAKDNKPEPNPDNVAPILCTVAAAGSANQTYLCKDFISVAGSVITLYVEEIATMNTTQATSWMRDRNVKVIYILATPIETDLTAEEIAQYSALHTNYPNTTIYNDEGAGMEVKYVADTKMYIDQKIAAISAAVLNA